jgi:hypothetical protein
MAKILLAEGAEPDTPSAGKIAIFASSAGTLCWKDDQGNVYCCGSEAPAPTPTGVFLFSQDGDALYSSDGDRLLGATP